MPFVTVLKSPWLAAVWQPCGAFCTGKPH